MTAKDEVHKNAVHMLYCVITEKNALQVSGQYSTKSHANVTNIANMNVRRQALECKTKDKLLRDRKKKEAPTALVQNKSDSHRNSLPNDKSEHYWY